MLRNLKKKMFVVSDIMWNNSETEEPYLEQIQSKVAAVNFIYKKKRKEIEPRTVKQRWEQ